ncbi:M48 family metallopeptidase [Lewinella sp. 4G2]|uniref:M48 family metallopeptidase n=1 Tax=Lewinella sp. 4G2 TaxID=1803372 RepID=UPI0007B4F263|nr:M48 family metallopeptidase [Lewinella sp. 4G2]OAV43301.1 hypothetical protein A3850_001780 [Lewinella sp. 4G2]
MAKRPRKVGERWTTLELDGLTVPVQVVLERGRRNIRASLASKALIIRVPDHLRGQERRAGIEDMLNWARATYQKKPEAFARFRTAAVADAYTFTIQDETYRINVESHPLKHHTISKQADGTLLALLYADDDRVESGKIIPKLLARYFANEHLPEVTKRVHELNERHFQRPVNSVKMSDTTSRWGSCSSKGNINLSSRLLLAPPEVLDAVIIHELAHLVEANHSSRFWAQVARALPDYKTYDRWLKEHGRSLSFQPTPVAD